MATAAFFVLAQLWAINMTGPEYLAAFGLFGMGELIGVYVPNYILSASRKADVRRNMALATLVAVPSAVFGPIFGAVTDYFRHRGVPDVGFLASFGLCAAIMAAGMVIALVRLPARPVPADAAEPVGKPAG
jgi:ABC-type phosphate transport system permease subunit